MNWHKDGTAAGPNQVFVFGSNVHGRHGAGAALAAKLYHGAVQGVGEGMTGRSYALPTVDLTKGSLPLGQVQEAVARFLTFARSQPETNFFVTRVGCGLAGYKDKDIAPMFKGAPDNCDMPEDWRAYLE